MALRLIIAALKSKYPKVPVITTDELQKLMKTSETRQRKLVLLDTREEREFKVAHLAKAVRLDPDETDMSKVIKMIQQKGGPPQDPKTVICYCAVGWRASIMSQRLLDKLEELEKQDTKPDMKVYSLEGAIFKWANESKEMVDPDGNSTPNVHGFDWIWQMLVNKDVRKLDP